MLWSEYTLSGAEVSDLFFNYASQYDYNTPKENAEDFLNFLPSLEKQGLTVEALVKDYLDRV